jgi:methionyl-tRNA formyltransferase
MKLVFCGTPEFAVPSLQALVAAGHDVELVVTQPDRPAGRKMELNVPAVKRLALELGLPIVQPERIKNNLEFRAMLESIRPDAIIVVAYGRIIPDWMLHLPHFGNINVHGSLLPKYRGAAPIQWAIANGETETGITTMKLDAGLDTGDTLLSQKVEISPDATAESLYPVLARVGSEVLLSTLEALQAGTIQPQPQDHNLATLAPILTRNDGYLDLSNHSAQQAYNRWRGFSTWPGAHAMFRSKRFIVHRMHVVSINLRLSVGALYVADGDLFVGAANNSTLVLDEVQLEGKPRMAGLAFAKGFQLRPGERLE